MNKESPKEIVFHFMKRYQKRNKCSPKLARILKEFPQYETIMNNIISELERDMLIKGNKKGAYRIFETSKRLMALANAGFVPLEHKGRWA